MINNELLLPLCFFLLLVFINGKNFYGFMILLTGLAVVSKLKNPKIAIVFVLLWAILFSSNKSSEYFQNTPTTDNNIPTIGPSVGATDISDNTLLPLRLKIKNQSKTYNLNMDRNNLFSDIYKQLEAVSGMDLTKYKIGLEMKSESGDTLMYYKATNNQTINSYNESAMKENREAKENIIENTIIEESLMQKYKFRVMYPIPLIENNSTLEFSLKTELDQLIFVFKNLTLVFDNDSIRNLLAIQKITTPSLLTQIDSSSNDLIVSLNPDDYRKIRNYGYIYPIPGFSMEAIITIIKQNPQLDLSSKETTIQQLNAIKGSFSNLQKEGLEFYKNPLIINAKYYELLNILEFNKLFNVNSVNDIQEVELKKEIDYMVILFKLNNVLTSIELNTDDESWKLKSLQRLSVNFDQYFGSTNEILLKYDVKTKITKKLFNKKIELDKNLLVDFDLINLSNKINQQSQLESKLYETEVEKQQRVEFEKIENLNKVGNIYEQQKNRNPELVEINKIEKEFSNIGLDIVNDIINLFGNFGEENFKNYIEFSDYEVEENTNKYVLHKYLYYFKQIIIIVTKDGRMFYVGLMFMVISLLLYFIESSK
jgi:hypothetical protein